MFRAINQTIKTNDRLWLENETRLFRTLVKVYDPFPVEFRRITKRAKFTVHAHVQSVKPTLNQRNITVNGNFHRLILSVHVKVLV